MPRAEPRSASSRALSLGRGLACALLLLPRPTGASAPDNDFATKLLEVWLEPKTYEAVWGRSRDFSSQRLFDTRVKTADKLATGPSWRFTRFQLAALSPDGNRVAFKALHNASGVVGLYHHDSEIADILDSDCDASTMVWSANGRYLAVEADSRVRNNALTLMAYSDDYSQTEISGDILSELGLGDYKFRYKSTPQGVDVWRTYVFAPRWASERTLRFKAKKVRMFRSNSLAPFEPKEESRPEDWTYDVIAKKFKRL